MKKLFRNPIFMFVLGAILFGGTTGVVATTILSKDISYTPKDKDWKVDNVQSALNDLYEKTITTITELNTQINTLKSDKNDLVSQVGTLQATNDKQSTTIQELKQRLASKNEVVFNSFNASEVKSYTISTGFRPSKVVIILPNTTTGFFEIQAYDSNINNNVYACWTNNVNHFGPDTPTNDGCTIANSLITINNNGFIYNSTSTTLGITYWYAIK